MVGKQFSIEEAERLLPSLSPLVLRAQVLKGRLEEYATLQQRVMTDGTEELVEPLDAEHQTMKEDFYDIVEQVNTHGCVLRDLENGIVDFATNFEGRDVFLTWRIGETTIRHWREPDDTFMARKRIIELR